MSTKASMEITYKINDTQPSIEQFLSLLHRSSLAERRPVDDLACIKGMLENSNLLISAWHDSKLVGIARSLTDFHYACYLSDLAVDKDYQGQGIGKQLQRLIQAQLGPKCKLILVAAPAADSYYAHLGFSNNPRCWILEPDQTISC